MPALLFAEHELNMQIFIILMIVIFAGFPLTVLTFHVVRRLIELHKIMNPVGTLYVTEDDEIYMELDDRTILEKPQGSVVMRVAKAKSKK